MKSLFRIFRDSFVNLFDSKTEHEEQIEEVPIKNIDKPIPTDEWLLEFDKEYSEIVSAVKTRFIMSLLEEYETFKNDLVKARNKSNELIKFLETIKSQYGSLGINDYSYLDIKIRIEDVLSDTNKYIKLLDNPTHKKFECKSILIIDIRDNLIERIKDYLKDHSEYLDGYSVAFQGIRLENRYDAWIRLTEEDRMLYPDQSDIEKIDTECKTITQELLKTTDKIRKFQVELTYGSTSSFP